MIDKPGSYADYMKLNCLLSLPEPITSSLEERTCAAERFFVVCHQTSELLASQVFVDLSGVALAARRSDWETAHVSLARAAALVTLTCQTLSTLLYLPIPDFLRFRPGLKGTSGAESEQFATLLKVAHHPTVRSINASLADAFPRIPHDEHHHARACSHDECQTANALDLMLQSVANWRELHLRIVRHFIGNMPGTGGTSGLPYLLRNMSNPAPRLEGYGRN